MFELRLNYKEVKLDVISIRCINCKREIGLFLKNTTFDKMITKFVLNEISHHVGMLFKKGMKYDIDENNHQYWFNKGTWYNTPVCLKLHGSIFEDFISMTLELMHM